MASHTSAAPAIRNALFLDGRWTPASGSGSIDVVDAATEELAGRVPVATAADASRAVEAAARAFEPWSAAPLAERIAILERVAAGLESRRDLIATTITREVGTTFEYSIGTQAGLPVKDARAVLDAAPAFHWEEPVGPSLVVREPVGVVAAITPWNFPLHQIMAKVAPALVAGCTLVVKPAGLAPLSAFILADVLEEAGLPPGVCNIITGPGAEIGEVLADHPLVDMVSLTGSVHAGSRVMELAARRIKRVALELGGKSATVVLDDADLESVIPTAVTGCFRNAGQNCSALSRLLVPRDRLETVEELAATATSTWVVGDPFDPATRIGPLVSADQRATVRGYIETGMQEGARLIAGGPEAPAGLDRGFFVQPTVFSGVDGGMRIAREEIFGPVLAILPYDGEDDAVRLANDSDFGLSGAVWSADPVRADSIARRLRTGRVVINGGDLNPDAPFGGYKQSGIGREFGRFGLEEYLETKTLQR